MKLESVVLKFDSQQLASNFISEGRNKYPNVTLASMSSTTGGEPYDKVLVAGQQDAIRVQLEALLGVNWKEYVIQGEVDENKDKEQ